MPDTSLVQVELGNEHPPLPTISECKHFLAVINDGRRAIGLDELDFIDFDGREPMDPTNCLSAHHLFYPAGFSCGITTVTPSSLARADEKQQYAALTAIGSGQDTMAIPESILAVTRPFDAETPGLRERLVEAGVVADE